MEQVPVIRDNMVQRCNWVEEATYSLQEIFGKANDRDDKGLQALADLYAGDALESLVAEQEITPEERRGPLVGGRIKFFAPRKEHEEPILSFDLQVLAGKPTPQSTTQGMFERYGLKVIGTTLGAYIPYLGTAKVTLKFQDGSSTDVESESPMEIPTTTVEKFESLKESQIIEFQVTEGDKNIPAKTWQKLGSVDERAVIQLQLVRAKHGRQDSVTIVNDGTVHLHCYNLGTIFVSVPMLGKRAREHLERQLQSANEARVMKEEMRENRENAKKKKKKKRREDDNTVEKFRDRMKGKKGKNDENNSTNNKIQMVAEEDDSTAKEASNEAPTEAMDKLIEETEFDELD